VYATQSDGGPQGGGGGGEGGSVGARASVGTGEGIGVGSAVAGTGDGSTGDGLETTSASVGGAEGVNVGRKGVIVDRTAIPSVGSAAASGLSSWLRRKPPISIATLAQVTRRGTSNCVKLPVRSERSRRFWLTVLPWRHWGAARAPEALPGAEAAG